MPTRRTTLYATDADDAGTVFVHLHLVETDDDGKETVHNHRTSIPSFVAPGSQLAAVNQHLTKLQYAPDAEAEAWPPVSAADIKRIQLACDEALAALIVVDNPAAELVRAQQQVASLTSGHETAMLERNEAVAAKDEAVAAKLEAERRADIREALQAALPK